MSEQTPKPQAGIWSLVAPDGRIWNAPTPIQAVAKEQRERIPPQVALKNILDALESDVAHGRAEKTQQALREDMGDPDAWSCVNEVAALGRCEQWCGNSKKCVAVLRGK